MFICVFLVWKVGLTWDLGRCPASFVWIRYTTRVGHFQRVRVDHETVYPDSDRCQTRMVYNCA
jgi:hypothetical protein